MLLILDVFKMSYGVLMMKEGRDLLMFVDAVILERERNKLIELVS